MISFGPFLTCYSGISITPPNIEITGYALEFSSTSQGVKIPIYRRKDRNEGAFTDYVFHHQDLPFTIPYQTYYSLPTQAGLFVGLESLIVALYEDHQVARPLMDFLSEFRDCLPLVKTPLFPNAKPRCAFKPQLTELGFYLVELSSYSRRITATVAWYSAPQKLDR